MLTLFYASGACSLAPHIALEEAGARYEATPVALSKGEQRSEAYLAINPRGRVPALRIGSDVLVENPAILHYIARSYPDAGLIPAGDALAEARCISIMSWLASTVHVAYAHIFRPERYAADETAHPAIKETGRAAFLNHLQEIERMLTGREWALGERYSVCDPYMFVFYRWGRRIELPMGELAAYTAHKDRMLQRPAVRRTLEAEGLDIA
ncbi:glutathione S-transferase family protein [Arenibaculum pallidiluteum]|uniref:glutathione S-transferase family protein n=1 Tax=Arenibaculum pallidiluteum TaxID=2812559 RepID=UPI001A96E31A|nr:glutathione S-transferase N-terminal domain-containing protein [Arenibaculum pallidiluteum]